jgi:hypothetical protein
MKIKQIVVAAASAGVLATLVATGVASADPTGAPTTRLLAGVGSDTTQDVMNGLSNIVVDPVGGPFTGTAGTKLLGSYNATGSATIQTKAATCTAVARPNGSGAGRTALLNSLNAADGCIQWSRSSSLNIAASTPSLTYIPYAIDALDFAITPGSVIPRSLLLSDLVSIYHCDPAFVGTGPNFAITPALPQAGSGTRSFWEAQMGITDAQVNGGTFPCIINGARGTQIWEEHSGILLDDKSLVPFSIPQYNDQETGLVSDKRGQGILGVIGGTNPVNVNLGFAVTREVYNVIPTTSVTATDNISKALQSSFVGSGSQVCAAAGQAVIQQFGFGLDANCGNTTQHS